MTKRRGAILTIAIIVSIIVFQVGVQVGASSKEPGSVGDPLITESYLEKRLSEITGKKTMSSATTTSGTTSTGQQGFEKVAVDSGKTITLQVGTEIIIYTGTGTISNNECMNLSTGELFKKGNTIVKYNIFMATKERTQIKTSGEVTAFVLGEYTIK